MRERWEVRAPSGFCERRFTSRPEAVKWLQVRALAGETVVHVRTYRVEVVYAWRQILGGYYDRHGLIVFTTKAARIYIDPLGKHSRRRAKAAALAAKPSGPCALVAVADELRNAYDVGAVAEWIDVEGDGPKAALVSLAKAMGCEP